MRVTLDQSVTELRDYRLFFHDIKQHAMHLNDGRI